MRITVSMQDNEHGQTEPVVGSQPSPIEQLGPLPRYQQMVRKDARLRPDQIDALTALRRQVAARRHRRGEALTDNTLLRIAVDLLLDRAEHLAGDTEDELRASVRHQ